MADDREGGATEIDFSWTYVAGSIQCVRVVLADDRLEPYEVAADDRADILRRHQSAATDIAQRRPT
ncbi:MAG TPA: hypothetical protein VHF25_16110 [Nitriliruptorales bacterium]|nr:hypothetical protein [Nitriliruptorales bacterium]